MDPADRNREDQEGQMDRDRAEQGELRETDRDQNVERNVGDDQSTGVSDREVDLQKEGNLGNERNRNEPDTEQRPGGSRENLNR